MERSEEKSLMQHVFSIMFNNIFLLFFASLGLAVSRFSFAWRCKISFSSHAEQIPETKKEASEEKFLSNKIAHCYDFSSFGP